MHSTLVRVQNVFGFFTSVAFAVAAAIAVSVLLSPQNPSASLELKNVRVVKGRPHYYSTKREEYAHVTFDLEADLSSLFNWNTKQVFAYITASYPSDNPQNVPDSEVVVWDAIIPSDYAPLHQNTYIHPTTTIGKDGKKKKKTFSKKERALGLAGKAYPEGTSPGILRLQDQKPKYQITDVSGKMAERPFATLTLHWNVQPWVGLLTWTNFQTYGRWQGLQGGISEVFSFPAVKEAVKKEELKTETGGESNRGKPA
ncbi:signal peptidase 22 kDa subunit [Sphaerulina musiva SO2202]|uniref:Signal peptidase subunit 3 n=1 Tax=Sphaerulina musiva (strain SO2202) TaxID=692275 RepID=N1QGM6_SPHMS|nr:signal peptidase 22 kDa subunit [Sphaerulina musiva SO2202]EMF11629.1 signal peptidase 22 kDa subunit [Sphaerulina musiva SO2202]